MVLLLASLVEVVLSLGKPRLQRLSLLEEDLDPLVGRLEGLGVLELELLNLVGVVRGYDGVLEPLRILLIRGWWRIYVNNDGQGWKLN
jgi:hypothetical protein